MPKISQAQGASHEGVIAEHDADLREAVEPEVQERIDVQGDDPEVGTDYSAYTVKQLVSEIEKRNEDRDADAALATTGNKGDLVARLVEDDERDAE